MNIIEVVQEIAVQLDAIDDNLEKDYAATLKALSMAMRLTEALEEVLCKVTTPADIERVQRAMDAEIERNQNNGA